ncbi:MAG: aldo/keto reductase [Bacillota bacterium]
MRYATLPGTSLEVSRVGMGCYAAAGAYGEFDRPSFIRLLQLGRDRGVTLYDTAPTYGDGEEILGEAVRPFRDEVVLATKVGLTPEGERDCSAEHVRSSCEESLRRLGVDHIDLYQVHYHDPRTPVAETVGAMEELRREGKIRHYGVGHLPLDQVREYLEIGRPVACLVELNCATREQYRRLFPVAGESAGIIGFSPSGRGLLSGDVGAETAFSGDDLRNMDPLYRGGRFRSALAVVGELQALAGQTGSTPVQVALRWAFELPGVTAVLTGTRSREHLAENIASADIPWDGQIQCRLNSVIKREEARFRAQLPGELETILRDEGPISRDTLPDLVYVIEQAVSSGWVAEEAIIPLFTRLWALRGGDIDEEKVRAVRQALLHLLFGA